MHLINIINTIINSNLQYSLLLHLYNTLQYRLQFIFTITICVAPHVLLKLSKSLKNKTKLCFWVRINFSKLEADIKYCTQF